MNLRKAKIFKKYVNLMNHAYFSNKVVSNSKIFMAVVTNIERNVWLNYNKIYYAISLHLN